MLAVMKSRKDIDSNRYFSRGRWDHTGNQFAFGTVWHSSTLPSTLPTKDTENSPYTLPGPHLAWVASCLPRFIHISTLTYSREAGEAGINFMFTL